METFKYEKIIKAISPIVKQQTDCTDFVPDSDMGDQPEYPFASYSFMSPHIKVTEDVPDHEIFELSMQIAVSDPSEFVVLDQVERIRKSMYDYQTSLSLDKQHIYLIDIDDGAMADNVLSVQIEHRAAVVLHFRVMDDFEDDIPSMDNATFEIK